MMDFELLLPDGWLHIPTTPETARLRRRIIDTVIRRQLPDSLPRDRAEPWRRMFRRELTEMADEAGSQGARAVVIPLRELHGVRIPGSLVLSVLEDAEAPEDSRSVLDAILADAGDEGTAVDIGGCPAVRVESVIDSSRIRREAPSVRVSYSVAAPGVPGVWGLLTFTVLTDGDVEADEVRAVIALFDLIVSTMRWADRVDVPTEDEVLEMVPAE